MAVLPNTELPSTVTLPVTVTLLILTLLAIKLVTSTLPLNIEVPSTSIPPVPIYPAENLKSEAPKL